MVPMIKYGKNLNNSNGCTLTSGEGLTRSPHSFAVNLCNPLRAALSGLVGEPSIRRELNSPSPREFPQSWEEALGEGAPSDASQGISEKGQSWQRAGVTFTEVKTQCSYHRADTGQAVERALQPEAEGKVEPLAEAPLVHVLQGNPRPWPPGAALLQVGIYGGLSEHGAAVKRGRVPTVTQPVLESWCGDVGDPHRAHPRAWALFLHTLGPGSGLLLRG